MPLGTELTPNNSTSQPIFLHARVPGLFRPVLLTCLSHSSVTVALARLSSMFILYVTYRAHDQRIKLAGIESAYLLCDGRRLTNVELRTVPISVCTAAFGYVPDLRSIVT